MKFIVDKYTIERVSPAGAWLVTTDLPVDLGLLFLRAQEYYESGNPEFIGKQFTMMDYIRWYTLNMSDEKSFTYFTDYVGFNIPGNMLDDYLQTVIHDLTSYDLVFARIIEGIKRLERNPKYYVIGALSKGLSVVEHEISHAMFYLKPAYRETATKLVNELEQEVIDKIMIELKKEGYSETVLFDEAQAYMSTGLLEALEDYEPLRLPFMKNFAKHKRSFLNRKKKKPKIKHVEPISLTPLAGSIPPLTSSVGSVPPTFTTQCPMSSPS